MDGHFVFSVLDYYSVPSQFLYMTFTALGPTFLLSKHLGRELLYRPVYVIPVGQIFKVIVSTYILTNSVWVLPLFHILTNTFHFRQPWGMYISLWSFLMTDKIEQLFIFIGHFCILFCQIPIQGSCHFSVGLLLFAFWFVRVLCAFWFCILCYYFF